MKIRIAQASDACKILEITQKAFTDYQNNLSKESPVTQALKETLHDVTFDISAGHVYVAEENGELIGSIRFTLLSPELAYIYRFGVLPDIKNTGVGSELLAGVIDICQERGVQAIALHTNSKYYKLARYYYGKEFYVHSTTTDRGYIRALFVKELTPNGTPDLSKAIAH